MRNQSGLSWWVRQRPVKLSYRTLAVLPDSGHGDDHIHNRILENDGFFFHGESDGFIDETRCLPKKIGFLPLIETA